MNDPKRPIETQLREFIVEKYNEQIKNDKRLEEKIRRNSARYEKEKLKKEKISDKIKEKEKRTMTLEDEFGFNTPRDMSRYKIR